MEMANNQGEKKKITNVSWFVQIPIPDYPYNSESERAASDISQKSPLALGPKGLRATSAT